MMTANELLNSLSMSNTENEGHIVIGVDRKITVPDSLKRIAVQFDHNIETVTFDCPRYWDGLDMSKMAVYINYMRSDKFADSYPVGAVTIDDVDPSIMHFDWTISRNVTSIDGGIVFLVCVKNTDADGLEINHWNSELCKDLTVSPGMENDEQFIDYQYDLVTQLLLEVESLREEVENIEITGGGGSPEIYVGSGDMPEGYVLQVNPDGDEVFNVDQTYSPESTNPQSGIAVAEALSTVGEKWEFINEIVFAEDTTIARIDNLLTGQQYREYKKLFIDFYIALATEKTMSLRFVPRDLVGSGLGIWPITPSYKFLANGFRNGSLYEERIDTQNGEKITRWFSTIVDSQVSESQFVSQGVMRFETASLSNIYQLSITPSISEDIPFLAGTYFKVYGVK